MDNIPQGSTLKKRHHIKAGCGRKTEYPVYLDDGGMFQGSNQPGFPDELVDGFGKDVFRVFIQGNQAMGVGISGAKLLRIVFLEDDLSVQRLVMGQIRNAVRPVTEDTFDHVGTDLLGGREGNECFVHGG